MGNRKRSKTGPFATSTSADRPRHAESLRPAPQNHRSAPTPPVRTQIIPGAGFATKEGSECGRIRHGPTSPGPGLPARERRPSARCRWGRGYAGLNSNPCPKLAVDQQVGALPTTKTHRGPCSSSGVRPGCGPNASRPFEVAPPNSWALVPGACSRRRTVTFSRSQPTQAPPSTPVDCPCRFAGPPHFPPVGFSAGHFCSGINASAKALPICAKIFALPK